MITLTIEGIPLAWKAPFVGTRGCFSPRHGVCKIFKAILADQYKGPVLDDPICCDLIFFMPIPKSASQKTRKAMLSGKIRPVKRPDRTNMAKLYEDLLIGLVIRDDSLIVSGNISKYYSDEPRSVINIESICTSS